VLFFKAGIHWASIGHWGPLASNAWVYTPGDLLVGTASQTLRKRMPASILFFSRLRRLLCAVARDTRGEVYNLKEAAKTLMFLQERGLAKYEALAINAEEISKTFYATPGRIKDIRIGEFPEVHLEIIPMLGQQVSWWDFLPRPGDALSNVMVSILTPPL